MKSLLLFACITTFVVAHAAGQGGPGDQRSSEPAGPDPRAAQQDVRQEDGSQQDGRQPNGREPEAGAREGSSPEPLPAIPLAPVDPLGRPAGASALDLLTNPAEPSGSLLRGAPADATSPVWPAPPRTTPPPPPVF
jgi:hypothetical protein